MNTLTLRVAARFQSARYKQKKKVRSEDGGQTTVYVYSEKQIAHRNREKAKRIQKLSKSIHGLRSKIKKDLKSSDPETMLTALAVSLMDTTFERVGNSGSADDGHFGVTGWQKKHVSFKSNGAFIKYVGKSGVKQEKKVSDAGIRKALKDAYEAMDDDDSCLFHWDGGKITASKVNAYLEPFDITAKDLRGFHANQEMRDRLKAVRSGGKNLSEDKKAREKQLKDEFKKALEETAEAVGHEPSTLKSQYLVPGLEDQFLKDGTIIDKLGSMSGAMSVLYQVGIKPGEHYMITCDGCGRITQCRCYGPRIEAHVPSCPECSDDSAVYDAVAYIDSEIGLTLI